jgi:hypothetical protein
MRAAGALLLTVVALAGCAPTAQNGFAGNTGAASATAVNYDGAVAEMNRMTEMDRQRVAQGLASPEVIPLEIEKAKLATEAQAIIASGDKAKARAWSERVHAIDARRNAINKQFTMAYFAKHPPVDTPANCSFDPRLGCRPTY